MTDFYSSGWNSVPNGGAKYRLHLIVNVAGQDVAANTTSLNWALYIEKDRSYQGFYDYWADWAVAINGAVVGTQTNVQNPTSPWTGWSAHLVGSGSTTVGNNTDGSLPTMAVAASWSRTGGGGPSGYAPGPMSLSSSMSLPVIPRATQPTVTPKLATVGSTVTIDLPRASASYTHDVTWVSGNLSGTVGTGLGASTTWVVPNVMGEFPGQPRAPIVIIAVTKLGGTPIGTRQITLQARNAPAVPAPPTEEELADESRQFDVRARLVTFDGGEWLARSAIPADTISLVDPSSATATCSISLSKINAVDFEDYSIVDVDVFNGDDWLFTNHRFVLSRVTDDEVDPTKASTYSGTEYLDFMLGLAYVQEDYFWDGSTNHAAPTTPGEMMRYAIAQAKARGWGPRVEINFSGTATSYGEPWTNTAVSRTYNKGTPLSQMLDGLVEDGLVEYRVEYHSNKAWLVLMNPGTGQTFADVGASPVVNLGLAPLTRAPRRGSIEKRLTRVTVVGDTVTNYGSNTTSADNTSTTTKVTREKAPFDPDVFGHLEGWVTASGITLDADAGVIADNALRDNSSAVNERTFEYDAAGTPPQFYPYSVYRPGDWVLIPDGPNTITDRISQITIDKQIDSKRLTVLTGDRILSGTASLAKRQSAMTGGSISGGNGMSPSPLDSRIPKAPVVSTVVSEGYWDSDGAARSEVTITWAAVTEALNGASLPVDLYEVYWRPQVGAEWALRTSTDQLQVSMPGWDVQADVEFRIRGRSTAGVFGEFSENQEHTTLAPPVDLDGPIIADLYSDAVGGIYVVWAGVLGTDPAPARLAYVVAEVSTDGGTIWTTEGTPIPGPGTIYLNKGGLWGDYLVRLRGYDRLGNAGDASAPEAITIEDPHIDPPIPSVPEGLAATPGAAWDASGFAPIAWFDLEWDVPTDDVSGNPIDIVGYDVWGKRTSETEVRFLTSSATNAVRYTVKPGEEWSFQVKAASGFGGVGELSDPVVALANATISAAPAPATPTLEQYAGILRIKWAGVGMLPSIKYVYATIATASGGPYTRAGMPLNGPGEVVVPGLAPGNYWAKIVMVDELGTTSTSAAVGPINLLPITGVTIQTSPLANTGIKMTDAALTAYDAAGVPTFILDAATGEVWIAPYDAVFELGASGTEAETGDPTTGIAISSENSSFNTFIHPSGVQIRNDQTPLSWWEADADDAALVNFVSPRARVDQRMRIGDYELLREAKTTGTRLVFRYKGA